MVYFLAVLKLESSDITDDVAIVLHPIPLDYGLVRPH